MNNCVWCSAGVSQDEKFCSQCGGPNTNYIDMRTNDLPNVNIGESIADYIHPLLDGKNIFQIPRVGILRRLIISTSRKLERVRIVLDGVNQIVDQAPRTNNIIYQNNIMLQTTNRNVSLEMTSTIKQDAKITIERDLIRNDPDEMKEQFKRLHVA